MEEGITTKWTAGVSLIIVGTKGLLNNILGSISVNDIAIDLHIQSCR